MRKTRFCATVLIVTMFFLPVVVSAAETMLYFPPEWATKANQAKAIAEAMSESTGLTIQPVVAQSYPEIIAGFSKNKPALVYVGSFLQAVLYARGLSTPILQGIDGKEFYSSVLIAPVSAGTDPVAIVKAAGSAIAYAKGTSSGESGAKAASGGAATAGTKDHYASVMTVTVGNVKCAFVKDWWWKDAGKSFKGVRMLEYPGISDKKNPDNVMSANKFVPEKDIEAIKAALPKNAAVFHVKSFKKFDAALLEPTLALMKKGNLDPKTYAW